MPRKLKKKKKGLVLRCQTRAKATMIKKKTKNVK